MAARAVTRENLGAWVIKCDPTVWDLVAMRAENGGPIESWSVGETYRNDLAQPGDRVVFWVSGTLPKEVEPGIWGVGWVVSRVHPAAVTGADEEYWRDSRARSRVRYALRVDIRLQKGLIVGPKELRHDPVLSGIEVLTMPRGSNPSYLTVEQWSALQPYLDGIELSELPLGAPDEVDELIEAPELSTRLLIEESAVETVRAWLDENGWAVEDRQRDAVGWDLTATRGSETALVEIKGRSGNSVDVVLTPNEFRAAQRHDNWELAVVTDALRANPKVHWFTAGDVRRDATWLYTATGTVRAVRPAMHEFDVAFGFPKGIPPIPADHVIKRVVSFCCSPRSGWRSYDLAGAVARSAGLFNTVAPWSPLWADALAGRISVDNLAGFTLARREEFAKRISAIPAGKDLANFDEAERKGVHDMCTFGYPGVWAPKSTKLAALYRPRAVPVLDGYVAMAFGFDHTAFSEGRAPRWERIARVIDALAAFLHQNRDQLTELRETVRASVCDIDVASDLRLLDIVIWCSQDDRQERSGKQRNQWLNAPPLSYSSDPPTSIPVVIDGPSGS
jgi:hypothetical protein